MGIKEYLVYIAYTVENEVYIGITKEPNIRWNNHIRNSSNKNIKTLISIGREFLFEALHKDLTLSEASTLEELEINNYEKMGSSILNIRRGVLSSRDKIVNNESHLKTLLTLDQVHAIRDLWNSSRGTLNQTDLANKYNVSLSTIHNIIHNKRWVDTNYEPYKSAKVSNSKLHSTDITTIRNTYYSLPVPRISGRKFAAQYNISGTHMNNILRGRIYSDKGGPILGKDY